MRKANCGAVSVIKSQNRHPVVNKMLKKFTVILNVCVFDRRVTLFILLNNVPR